MSVAEMTVYFALGLGAIVAAFAYFKVLTEREGAASRRKPGAVSPQRAPDDTPATAPDADIGLLKRLLALETRFEQIETRFTDLKESTDRRFGRLNQARSRGTLPDAPPDAEEDDETLPLFPSPAARSSAAPRNGTRPRALIPRR